MPLFGRCSKCRCKYQDANEQRNGMWVNIYSSFLYDQLKLWSRNANNFFYFLANLFTWKVCVPFWSKDAVYLFSQIIWGHVEWKNKYTIPVFMSFRFISRLYKWKFAQSYKVTWLSDLNGNVLEDKSIKWRIE